MSTPELAQIDRLIDAAKDRHNAELSGLYALRQDLCRRPRRGMAYVHRHRAEAKHLERGRASMGSTEGAEETSHRTPGHLCQP